MRLVLAVLASFVVCACGTKPAPAPSTTKPTESTADAARVAATPPTPPAPKKSREELAQAAVARVPAITTEVARLRGLDAKPVPAAYQKTEDFKTFLRAQLALELPPEKSGDISRALFAVGLLKEKIDLGAVVEAAMLSQAGAYYDPEQKKFFIVMVPENDMMLDTLSSHELMHAVQDQHFDLLTYLGGKGNKAKLTTDQVTARRFVVEGEASLMMFAYMGTKMGGGADPFAAPGRAALGMQVKMTAGLDADAIGKMAKDQGATLGALGPDFKDALAAIDTIPPVVLVPLYDAYFKGAQTTYQAFEAGGWDAVAKLYTSPPASSEQVLHAPEKLVGKRDQPTPVKLPAPKALAGYKKIHEDDFGELLWRVYFTLWGSGAVANAAAAGWDGDWFAVYAKGDETVALVSTVWDSATEATEFEAALTPTLATRGVTGGVRRAGDRVHLVTGCEPKLCETLLTQLQTISGPIVP